MQNYLREPHFFQATIFSWGFYYEELEIRSMLKISAAAARFLASSSLVDSILLAPRTGYHQLNPSNHSIDLNDSSILSRCLSTEYLKPINL
jgi:hypothetical protein